MHYLELLEKFIIPGVWVICSLFTFMGLLFTYLGVRKLDELMDNIVTEIGWWMIISTILILSNVPVYIPILKIEIKFIIIWVMFFAGIGIIGFVIWAPIEIFRVLFICFFTRAILQRRVFPIFQRLFIYINKRIRWGYCRLKEVYRYVKNKQQRIHPN